VKGGLKKKKKDFLAVSFASKGLILPSQQKNLAFLFFFLGGGAKYSQS